MGAKVRRPAAMERRPQAEQCPNAEAEQRDRPISPWRGQRRRPRRAHEEQEEGVAIELRRRTLPGALGWPTPEGAFQVDRQPLTVELQAPRRRRRAALSEPTGLGVRRARLEPPPDDRRRGQHQGERNHHAQDGVLHLRPAPPRPSPPAGPPRSRPAGEAAPGVARRSGSTTPNQRAARKRRPTARMRLPLRAPSDSAGPSRSRTVRRPCFSSPRHRACTRQDAPCIDKGSTAGGWCGEEFGRQVRRRWKDLRRQRRNPVCAPSPGEADPQKNRQAKPSPRHARRSSICAARRPVPRLPQRPRSGAGGPTGRGGPGDSERSPSGGRRLAAFGLGRRRWRSRAARTSRSAGAGHRCSRRRSAGVLVDEARAGSGRRARLRVGGGASRGRRGWSGCQSTTYSESARSIIRRRAVGAVLGAER